MPTYGYRCPKCSNEFEVWQTMRDEPGAPCPSCGAAAKRMFFPAGIVFKGSGFYKTDSRGAESSSITSASSDSSKPPSKGSSNGDASPKSDSATSATPSTTSTDTSTTTKKAASTDTAG